MPPPPQPVPVVCAIIERGGRVLLARRPAHKHRAHQWEFPGGKVERGERPAAALAREIREELGCAVIPGAALPRVADVGDGVPIELIPFVCRLRRGSPEPAPLEHGEIRWVAPGALLRHDLAAPDRPVARAYLRRTGQAKRPGRRAQAQPSPRRRGRRRLRAPAGGARR